MTGPPPPLFGSSKKMSYSAALGRRRDYMGVRSTQQFSAATTGQNEVLFTSLLQRLLALLHRPLWLYFRRRQRILAPEQCTREILMRRVGGLVAVLLILGLAAAGFVSAQKGTTGSSPAAAVANLPAASTSQTAAASSQRTPVNPVGGSFQAGTDGAPTRSAEPTRLAEATRAAPANPN